MSSWLQAIVVALVPALIAAVVTAWTTVNLSVERFRAERWWERKPDAYSRIVECLYIAKVYYENASPKWWDEHQRGERREESEDDRRREAESSAALHELVKATPIGAYVISDEAAKVLDGLKNRKGFDWDQDMPSDVYDHEAKGYTEGLQKPRDIAKKDLTVS